MEGRADALCYGCLGRESELNVVVGFCVFPEVFNEVLESPGMRLGGHTLRRNQFAPMSENRVGADVHPRSNECNQFGPVVNVAAGARGWRPGGSLLLRPLYRRMEVSNDRMIPHVGNGCVPIDHRGCCQTDEIGTEKA